MFSLDNNKFDGIQRLQAKYSSQRGQYENVIFAPCFFLRRAYEERQL